MTRHNLFHAIQTAIISRLLLIIIVLMIASLVTVLPIKGCANAGRQTGLETTEISAVHPAHSSKPGAASMMEALARQRIS
ncbi:hypothetical protein [Ensifer sesbaniae]|nr:hypothetical protein [Ensifer sesbaniae]NRQ12880.1 hypothetical protein [Ensifer sesbaniae]